MGTEGLFGSPDQAFPLADAVKSALTPNPKPSVMRLGFPFVSCAGVEALFMGLDGYPPWMAARKTWLVGVTQGVTEPAALARISVLPDTEVRVFSATGDVSERTLRTRPMFHAKVVGVEIQGSTRRSPSTLDSLIVSSANLTRAAVGAGRTHFEAGAIISAPTETTRAKWVAWWGSAWASGLPLTAEVLERYALLRERFIRANPVVLENADPPSHQSLASALTFWIEAGAMSGGSRNQVEFNRDLAAFFGTVSRQQRMITLEIGRSSWDDRPLSPKVTTFGVKIWRLSLPTEAKGGFEYPGKVIRFRRRSPGDPSIILDVATPGSRAVRSWQSEANRTGYLGVTSGNRAFGFF
jgi:hypothetical protein